MNAKWNWRLGTTLIVCLAGAGCREPSPAPTELSEQMQRDLRLATPTVGGPTQEFFVARTPTEVAKSVAVAMENSGVRLVQEGSTAQGPWMLGKSLADRSVLVQILPVYPGRSAVKVTIEGGDAVARELLAHLSASILHRAR
jgi:hypothetical protein